MSKFEDKWEELKEMFDYWNNRGKSAICRFILDELGISLKEFVDHCRDWEERKLVIKDGRFDVEISPTNGYSNPKYHLNK